MDRLNTTPMNIVEEAGETIKERILRTQVVDVEDVVITPQMPMFLLRYKPILGLLNQEPPSKLNILRDLGMWYR